MKKRLFSLLLSVLLVCSLMPGFAQAANTGLYFTVKDGEATLTDASWNLSGEVTIPATYQDAPVTAIADEALVALHDITAVTIPEGVRTIGLRAFGSCDGLKSVSLPSPLESLGDEAFLGCTALTAISLPEGVERVGAKSFFNCYALKDVTLPASLRSIGEEAFYGCVSLERVALPEGLTSVEPKAFMQCRKLSEVTIPSMLRIIGERVFSECGFTRLTLPEGVEALSDRAFFDCQDLVEMTIPTTMKSIGAEALGANNQGTLELHFLGAAPTLADSAFSKRVMVADYPADDVSWKEAVKKDYGASDIHWNGSDVPPAGDDQRDPSEALKPLISDNHADQNYPYSWSENVFSYLVDNGDGTITRVEYQNEKAPVVEIFDNEWNLVWKQTLPMELEKWGGFYAGTDYNFFVFGQDNLDQNDGAEVIRIVRYTKNWHRAGAASLTGNSVRQPFVAGSLRMTQDGDVLYIHTSRNMYAGEDGKAHQSNLSLSLHIPTMSALRDNRGYASHSFNQFVLTDNTNVVRLDHGDAYPRALVITRFMGEAGTLSRGEQGSLEILPIMGSLGATQTGVQVGGFAASSTHYLTVGKSVEQKASGNEKANVFVIATDKEAFDAEHNTLRWITSYRSPDAKTPEVSNAQIVPVGNDRFLLLWCETKGEADSLDSTLHYVFLSGKGETASKVYTREKTLLSDCQPIVFNGGVVWYATAENSLRFYRIDLKSPKTVDETEISGGFTDVEEDAYYADAVTWAVAQKITNGTTKTTFSPGTTCTRAQMVTFLWRSAGSPAPKSTKNPFTDVEKDKYYIDAVLWAVEKGITQGTSKTTFSPDATVTRGQTVTFLWRLAGEPEAKTSKNPFKDVSTKQYYAPAVLWAVEKEITNGTSKTTFEPSRGCTRGQIVTFLYRYYEG